MFEYRGLVKLVNFLEMNWLFPNGVLDWMQNLLFLEECTCCQTRPHMQGGKLGQKIGSSISLIVSFLDYFALR